jgi:DNA-binding transcriptional LysR family regulator
MAGNRSSRGESMHITIRQLQVFESVATYLSYTRAAEQLHLTQPAVSMQVKQLEAVVGVALFEQIGKRVFLTRAGEVMLDHCRRINRQIDDLKHEVAELGHADHGRLRVTIASTVNYFAARMLARFSRRYPDVGITLDVTNREALLKKLEDNEPDIVLMGQPPEGIDVDAWPFKENPLIVIASPGHRLARRRQIPLTALADQVFVIREPGSGTRMAMERMFDARGFEPVKRIEMSGNEAIKQSVEAGLGLAVVSRHTVELELESGRLVELRVQGFPIVRQWYLAHRRGKRLSPTAQTFKEFVLDAGAADNGG